MCSAVTIGALNCIASVRAPVAVACRIVAA
jgi:hypothetical protein